jgi:hypothetical protein
MRVNSDGIGMAMDELSRQGKPTKRSLCRHDVAECSCSRTRWCSDSGVVVWRSRKLVLEKSKDKSLLST